jgi:uroporphyrinogen decarboxylase
MTNNQWISLLAVINGDSDHGKDIGFIIDSPWLPGWSGNTTLDYYTSDEIWLKSNFQAIDTFPEITFLPGFWSEYGMCTEPSAFGARLVWVNENLPHAERMLHCSDDIVGFVGEEECREFVVPYLTRAFEAIPTENINAFISAVKNYA